MTKIGFAMAITLAIAPAASAQTYSSERNPNRDYVERWCRTYALIVSVDIGRGGPQQEMLRQSTLNSCHEEFRRTRKLPPIPPTPTR